MPFAPGMLPTVFLTLMVPLFVIVLKLTVMPLPSEPVLLLIFKVPLLTRLAVFPSNISLPATAVDPAGMVQLLPDPISTIKAFVGTPDGDQFASTFQLPVPPIHVFKF